AVLGVKDVLLLHRHPRQLAPLLGDLAAQLGVLGLALCQLVAGGLPLLTCSYLRGHSVLLLGAFGVWTDAQPENHRSARAPPHIDSARRARHRLDGPIGHIPMLSQA